MTIIRISVRNQALQAMILSLLLFITLTPADFTTPTTEQSLVEVLRKTKSSPYIGAQDTRDVAIKGGYMAAAESADGIRLFNVSDPYNMMELDQYFRGIYAISIVMKGGYIYTAWANFELTIHTVANGALQLERTVKLGDEDFPPTYLSTRDMVIENNLLILSYWGRSDSGFFIYDISDPVEPSFLSMITEFNPYAFHVAGDLLVEFFNQDLEFYDISNPSQPTFVGSVSGMYSAGVTIVNNYLLSSYDHILSVYDISDVANSNSIASVYFPDCQYFREMIVENDLVYGRCDHNIALLNVSDVYNIQLLDTLYDPPSNDKEIYGIAVDNGIVATARRQAGAFLLDNVANILVETDSFESPSLQFRHLEVADKYVFATTVKYHPHRFSLIILEELDETLQFVQEMDFPAEIYDLLVNGNYLYISSSTGVFVYSFADIFNLSLVAYLEGGAQVSDVVVDAGLLYVNRWDSLVVYNATTISNSSIPMSSRSYGIYDAGAMITQGEYIYVTYHGQDTPVRVFKYNTTGLHSHYNFTARFFNGFDIAIHENYLLMPYSGRYHLLQITPNHELVDSGDIYIGFPFPNGFAPEFTAIQVNGSDLYLASYNWGLHRLDISNILFPTHIASYVPPFAAYDLKVVAERIYLTQSSGHIDVVEIAIEEEARPPEDTNPGSSPPDGSSDDTDDTDDPDDNTSEDTNAGDLEPDIDLLGNETLIAMVSLTMVGGSILVRWRRKQ